jgi:hypothetical protein
MPLPLTKDEDLNVRDIALFPISLSNQEFSTGIVLPALGPLFLKYSKIMFLVADQLQIYNKALRISEGLAFGSILEEFSRKTSYLDERNRWIKRITSKIDGLGNADRWTVIGVGELVDDACFRIFRNVMLAYYSLSEFRDDIDHTAETHARNHNERYPLTQRELLSRGYLLEEIAISLRVHVAGHVSDEYYIGRQSVPILKLYAGKYKVSASELAQNPRRPTADKFLLSRSRGRFTPVGRGHLRA